MFNHSELVIKKAKSQGVVITQSVYYFIEQKLLDDDINHITIKNRNFYYTKINDKIYYCTYANKKKRIDQFYNPKSFTKNKEGQWEYKKLSKNKQVHYRRKFHAIQRAMDRFALLITDDLYDELVSLILDNKGEELFREKSRIEKNTFIYYYKIIFQENEYFVLFSKDTNSIISFYQNKWFYQDDDGKWRKKQSNKSKKVSKTIRNQKSHKIKNKKKQKYNRRLEIHE